MIHRVNFLLQSHHRFRFLISPTAKRFEEPDSDTSAPRLVIPVAESVRSLGKAPVQAIQNDDSICDTWPPSTHHLSTLASSPSGGTFTSSIHYL